jgi:hypothetical protein
MSLWQKPMSEIDFEDIDKFCASMPQENSRLDFKLDPPKRLEKTIAAFANTLGGLILIGIDSDQKTNAPVWPPQRGLPAQPGLEERIYQKAIQAIYPPVTTISVSAVIENQFLPGHVILAVRVDESRAAPHAVDDRQKVYIYERSGSTTEPHQLAQIDRIQYLIERRKAIEVRKDELRAEAFRRIPELLGQLTRPWLWVSIVPVFVWRPLCPWSLCHVFLTEHYADGHIQRVQHGAIALPNGRTTVHPSKAIWPEMISCDAFGHFAMGRLTGDFRQGPDALFVTWRNVSTQPFPFGDLWGWFHSMLLVAHRFYKFPGIERPGDLSIQVALCGCKGVRLMRRVGPEVSHAYPDDEYRDEQVVSASAFLENYEAVAGQLRARMAYAFDLETAPGL